MRIQIPLSSDLLTSVDPDSLTPLQAPRFLVNDQLLYKNKLASTHVISAAVDPLTYSFMTSAGNVITQSGSHLILSDISGSVISDFDVKTNECVNTVSPSRQVDYDKWKWSPLRGPLECPGRMSL